jgi:hypothetical protein
MTTKNATPQVQQRGGKLCPVCGKSSYSRDGIHPQCAQLQADQPRQQELADEKKRQAKVKPVKTKQKSWKKKCPKCKLEVHVRLKVCGCGHTF